MSGAGPGLGRDIAWPSPARARPWSSAPAPRTGSGRWRARSRGSGPRRWPCGSTSPTAARARRRSSGGRRLRAPRRPGEQRVPRRRARRFLDAGHRPLAQGHGRQLLRHAPPHPGRARPMVAQGDGRIVMINTMSAVRMRPGFGALLGIEGGAGRGDQDPGRRAGRARRAGQRRAPGLHLGRQRRAVLRPPGRREGHQPRGAVPGGGRRRPPSATCPRRPRSPRPSCSSPPTCPSRSPARPWASTPASGSRGSDGRARWRGGARSSPAGPGASAGRWPTGWRPTAPGWPSSTSTPTRRRRPPELAADVADPAALTAAVVDAAERVRRPRHPRQQRRASGRPSRSTATATPSGPGWWR